MNGSGRGAAVAAMGRITSTIDVRPRHHRFTTSREIPQGGMDGPKPSAEMSVRVILERMPPDVQDRNTAKQIIADVQEIKFLLLTNGGVSSDFARYVADMTEELYRNAHLLVHFHRGELH